MAGDRTVYVSFINNADGTLFTSTLGYNGVALARLQYDRKLSQAERDELEASVRRYVALREREEQKFPFRK